MAGRQNIRSGPKKQIKALLDQQNEWRKTLQTEGDEAKIRSNNKIISVIDKAIKPELEKKKSEHKLLSETRARGDKGDKEARKEKIDSLKTEIDDRLVLLNLTSLLATYTPNTRKGYLKLLKNRPQ